MSDPNAKLRESYQGMVNEMTKALAEALEKKDFVALDLIRVPAGLVYMDLADSMVELNIISDEQALALYNKWKAIEDRIDHEEMRFTTENDEERDGPTSDTPEEPGTSLSLDDMRELPEELW